MKLCKRASDGSFPSTCTVDGVPRSPRCRIRHREALHAGRRHARAARELPVRSRAGWRMVVSRRAIRPGGNAAPRVSSEQSAGTQPPRSDNSFCWRQPIHSSERSIGPLDALSFATAKPATRRTSLTGSHSRNGQPGRDLQGHPQRANVRLSEPAGQRCLHRSVSQRELGQGEDLGLSYPQVSGWRSCGDPSAASASRGHTSDAAAKRRPVG